MIKRLVYATTTSVVCLSVITWLYTLGLPGAWYIGDLYSTVTQFYAVLLIPIIFMLFITVEV